MPPFGCDRVAAERQSSAEVQRAQGAHHQGAEPRDALAPEVVCEHQGGDRAVVHRAWRHADADGEQHGAEPDRERQRDVAARQRPLGTVHRVLPAVGDVVPHHACGVQRHARENRKGYGGMPRELRDAGRRDDVGGGGEQRADAQQAKHGQQGGHAVIVPATAQVTTAGRCRCR